MKSLDLRVTKEASEGIGFVLDCLFCEAITIAELRHWADSVMLELDEFPTYLVELSEFNGYLAHINQVIGFAPVSDLNDAEQDALCAIADLRDVDRYEPVPSKTKAKKSLLENPHILSRFGQQFPLIKLNAWTQSR